MFKSSLATLRDKVKATWQNLRPSEDLQEGTTVMGIRQGNPKVVAKMMKTGKCVKCKSKVWRDILSDESAVYNCTNPECDVQFEILFDDFDDDEEEI